MSSLGFASGAYLRAVGTRDAFGAASDQLVSEGYPAIVINSGDREYADQVAIFLLRYVQAGDIRGRRVYDIRYWNGVAWYRISADGTVAVPGTSNHESRRAADLAYPYNNRSTAGHRRLQQIAAQFGLKWTGVNFGEDWHWENVGSLGAISQAAGSASAGTATQTKEWDEMASKQEIKEAVSEVISSRPDAVVISYAAAGNPRNGIVLAAPGFWHRFSAEQWTQFNAHGANSGLKTITPVNDRDYDVFKEIYTVNSGFDSAAQTASIAALQAAIKTLSAGAGVDPTAIIEAAQKGAEKALSGLTLKAA